MKKIYSFRDMENVFRNYKKRAGNIPYVSCFGPTFIDPCDPVCKMAEKFGEYLIESGFGVVHGGYCGVMEAVSKGADRAINKDKRKNKYWNIGVPMVTFDQELKRSSMVNLPSAVDIFDRAKALVLFGDICVVFPKGGFGTVLEFLGVFHSNQIAKKFGGKIRPLIFVGKRWESFFAYLPKVMYKFDHDFCYFVNTKRGLIKAFNEIKTKYD
jgi:predicted Rossmann-fold nucleotide-binding protein